MTTSVLVVDDDPRQAQMLQRILTSRGYVVRTAQDTEAAAASLRGWPPALVAINLVTAETNGVEWCRVVRKMTDVPVIVLSGNADAAAEVAALDAGADDYIVKPFVVERLLARVRGAVRRSPRGDDEPSAMGVGAFHIDFNDRRVQVHGQKVRLTPKEFDLFVFMARHPNRVLAHKTLLGAVWGRASEDQSEYLRVFMGQLRKKLETDPSRPQYLVTEPWVGYRFNPAGPMQ